MRVTMRTFVNSSRSVVIFVSMSPDVLMRSSWFRSTFTCMLSLIQGERGCTQGDGELSEGRAGLRWLHVHSTCASRISHDLFMVLAAIVCVRHAS